MGGETRLSFVGPIPVKQFFRKFLPTPLSFRKQKRDQLVGFETMSAAGPESQMYDEFVRSLLPPISSMLFLIVTYPDNHREFNMH